MKNGKVRLGVLLKFLIDNGYVGMSSNGVIWMTDKAHDSYEEYKKNPEGALMQMELDFEK